MNRYLRWITLSAYAVLLLFSMVVAFKAGAAFFYYKITLQPENFQPDAGFSYRYRVKLPPVVFPPSKMLVFENGQQLSLKSDNEVTQDGNGAYATAKAPEGGFYIYLAPKENSDPSTDGKNYRLYLANIFFSRPIGILFFSILLFGVLLFGGFVIRTSAHRKLRSFPGLIQVSDDFVQQMKAALSLANAPEHSFWRSRLIEAKRLFIYTAGAAYGLIFMEWLFQVTKPSFMDGMSLGQKLEIFLLSGLALTIVCMVINIVFLLIGVLLHRMRLAWLSTWITVAVPALLLTALIVLWFDHFTYTLFQFGILTSSNPLRTGYGILIMLTFLIVYRWLISKMGQSDSTTPVSLSFTIFGYFILVLLAVSVFVIVIHRDRLLLKDKSTSSPTPLVQNLPNIILIGSDGLSARNMSLYGYFRDTTPNINRLAQDSLVAENAFTNSGTTLGSIGTILTSKMPTRTGLIYPPDILQGNDSYEHLPKILKDLGYNTVQLGVPYYVDAYASNFQDGFDSVNQRSIKKNVLVQALNRLGFNDLPALFIQTLEDSFVDRLFHAFNLENIENPFTIVTQAAVPEDDANKMHDLLELFKEPGAPVFVHAHMMGTHAYKFNPIIRTFSAGEKQDQDWMIDFYDDAILSFDQEIGDLIAQMKANGAYDKTLIILYSDHAMQWEFNERIPLLIHFPTDQYRGKIPYNVQNLDIAPTILDYLGLPIPTWMEGRSLLQPGSQERRLIFSVSTNKQENQFEELTPPTHENRQVQSHNYKFSVIQVIDCQRWYRLDLQTYEWTSGNIYQHTSPCPEDTLLDMTQIKQAVIQYLSSVGFDASSIP